MRSRRSPAAPGEAAALLARRRPDPESSQRCRSGELTRLCGSLPLAIGRCSPASCGTTWPGVPREEFAADVAAARDSGWPSCTRRMYRSAPRSPCPTPTSPRRSSGCFARLGLLLGPSIDAYAAAALDGTTLNAARRGLEDLYDQHLLTEPAPGRYQLHDLLREHARALAAADNPAESDAAERAGRWTTTCTPPWPQAGTSPRRPPPAAHRLATRGPRLPTCPPSSRRAAGWMPSVRTCTPPPTTLPTAHVPVMPSRYPRR